MCGNRASCDVTDAELLERERPQIPKSSISSHSRQIPYPALFNQIPQHQPRVRYPINSKFTKFDAIAQDDAESEEPRVAYQVLRLSDVGTRRRGEFTTEGRATLSAVFSNIPAFRQKLSNALSDHHKVIRFRKEEDAMGRRGLGFLGKMRLRSGLNARR